jgi:PAS domain-containing protein
LSRKELEEEISRLRRKVDREKTARVEAEVLLEKKSEELYQRNQELEKLNKNLEHRISQRTNILSALIKSLNQGILVEDENRRILLTNAALREMFNIELTNEEMIGADCVQAAEIIASIFEDPQHFL